jgi:ElaB/YqjD/DUF883 family membrane-anchored ribosome-binding protein
MDSNRTSDVLTSDRFVMPSEASGQHESGMTQSRWKEKLDAATSHMRDGVRGSISKTQHHLRTHPGPWVASAVGAGFGVGLLGRLLMHRRAHRAMPEVIVISGAY